ncbi:aromatic amino acid ammonia-lyase [Agromyces atrinae]|uniref:aromatic amino acid lyase n=1 Tax=Agromyces atrinae TaxID=592376 RepID=UPI001F55D394|nr:aromatic amino acid lyase [Agromyces atrinae]MCI2958165.1 aromatic amino acid ammonia-lyase [Agromyces atrinae]
MNAPNISRAALGRVVASLATRSPAPAWREARERIVAERATVDGLLSADPVPSIYGFTTLLGHLDAEITGVDDVHATQRLLLESHLIGDAYDISASVARLVSAAKTEQLHQGGSGIDPDLYDLVVESTTRFDQPIRGAWSASYGSGDVVPASWWASAVVGDRALVSGSTIALINGSFYAAAVATLASLKLIDATSRVLALLARHSPVAETAPVRGDGLPAERLVSVFDRHPSPPPGDAQAPVSLRDSAPVIDTALTTFRHLGSALERRLGRTSANPLFIGEGGSFRATSQSSFLDPVLTLALGDAEQLARLVLGVAHRVSVHTAAAAASTGAARPDLVQPPKVISALIERADRLGGRPTRFSGDDSEGVEDLRDGALLSAITVLELARVIEDAVDLLGGAASDDAEEIRRALQSELLGAEPPEGLDEAVSTIAPNPFRF